MRVLTKTFQPPICHLSSVLADHRCCCRDLHCPRRSFSGPISRVDVWSSGNIWIHCWLRILRLLL